MVACNEYLVRVRELLKPVDKVENFLLSPVLSEVSAMNQDVSFRDVLQLLVLAVGVRYLDDSHIRVCDFCGDRGGRSKIRYSNFKIQSHIQRKYCFLSFKLCIESEI